MASEEEIVKSEWGRRAGAVVRPDRTIEIYKHEVTKDSVERLDISGVDGILARLSHELRTQGEFLPCNLEFGGYAEDSMEVFEIPDIRRWCAAAFEKAPCLPFLLSEATMQPFVWALAEVLVVERKPGAVRVKLPKSNTELSNILFRAGDSTLNFFVRCGLEPADTAPYSMTSHCLARFQRAVLPSATNTTPEGT